jgi:hypothetical protein
MVRQGRPAQDTGAGPQAAKRRGCAGWRVHSRHPLAQGRTSVTAHYNVDEASSLETLPDHAADVILVMIWETAEGGTDTLKAFLSEPAVQTLLVVQSGQVFALDGSAMVGSALAKPIDGLDQIESILSQPGLDLGLVAE